MDPARRMPLYSAAKVAASVDARQARKNDMAAALQKDVQQLKEESALNRLPVSNSILYDPYYMIHITCSISNDPFKN